MTLFLKVLMVLPHGCHHEGWQHLPWYRLVNVVPLDILLLAMEGHLSRQAASRADRHSSAVWEPCYIFLPSITPETYLVAVTLDATQISLNPAHLNLPRMGNDLQRHWGLVRFLMVQLCGQHCGQAGSGVGPVLPLLYLLIITSGMGRLGAGPIKFAWIAMPFTLWEVLSPLTVFCRFSIHVLRYRRVVKVPG